ncbi:MAG: metalloregulator ArsR/SmtB family transcription factor [Sphingomicrobium sp.]
MADPAATFSALGDPTRLAIVDRLAHSADCSIHELSADFPISRQAMSKHLRVLEQARIVRSGRFGREVRFRLEQAELERAQAFLGRVAAQWQGALHRLAKHLDSD